jgi:hypothetical protein
MPNVHVMHADTHQNTNQHRVADAHGMIHDVKKQKKIKKNLGHTQTGMTIQCKTVMHKNEEFVLTWPTDPAGEAIFDRLKAHTNTNDTWRVVSDVVGEPAKAIVAAHGHESPWKNNHRLKIYKKNPKSSGYPQATAILQSKPHFLACRMHVIRAIRDMCRALGLAMVDPKRIYVNINPDGPIVSFAYPQCALDEAVPVERLLNPAANPGWQCSPFTRALYNVEDIQTPIPLIQIQREKLKKLTSFSSFPGIKTLANDNYLVRRISVPDATSQLTDDFFETMHAFLREKCIAGHVKTSLVVGRKTDVSLMLACCDEDEVPGEKNMAFADWVSSFVLVYSLSGLTELPKGARLSSKDAMAIKNDLYNAGFRVYFPSAEAYETKQSPQEIQAEPVRRRNSSGDPLSQKHAHVLERFEKHTSILSARIDELIVRNIRVRQKPNGDIEVVWINLSVLLPVSTPPTQFSIDMPAAAQSSRSSDYMRRAEGLVVSTRNFYSPKAEQTRLANAIKAKANASKARKAKKANEKKTRATRPNAAPRPDNAAPRPDGGTGGMLAMQDWHRIGTAQGLINVHVAQYTAFHTQRENIINEYTTLVKAYEDIKGLDDMQTFVDACIRKVAPDEIPLGAVMALIKDENIELKLKKRHLYRLCVRALLRNNTQRLEKPREALLAWHTFLIRYLVASPRVFSDVYTEVQKRQNNTTKGSKAKNLNARKLQEQEALKHLEDIVKSVQTKRSNAVAVAEGATNRATAGGKRLKATRGLRGHMSRVLPANERQKLEIFASDINALQQAPITQARKASIEKITREYRNEYFKVKVAPRSKVPAPTRRGDAARENADKQRLKLHTELYVSKVATISIIVNTALRNPSLEMMRQAIQRKSGVLRPTINPGNRVKAQFFRLALAKWTRSEANQTIDRQIEHMNKRIVDAQKHEAVAVHRRRIPEDEKRLRIEAIALRFQRMLMRLDNATKVEIEQRNWADGS